ncbi:MAG: L,D-transpeptidase family protein [Pseudomonadota bacterium]|nr:L,D-transpeptidase family protein [Pseudomonadota bacterium]
MKFSLANALRRTAAIAVLALLAAPPVFADGLVPRELAAGEFEWAPKLSPQGAMVVVVSLPEQRAHVYRDGVRIGVSTISSGKPGNDTPTGVFPILQKKRLHHSNLYNNAPMPYMQRLTWDGIALHAGKIPGTPASHGCVRLPLEFSKLLFDETEHGMLVVIADEMSHGADVAWPGERVPVDYLTGLALDSDLPTPPAADTLAQSFADY